MYSFPRKIGGRYAVLHRRYPKVWLAYSDDCATGARRIWLKCMARAPKTAGTPPVWAAMDLPLKHEHGWVCINHAYDRNHVYHMGVVLLDLEDPSRVIRRPEQSIFWPEQLWELRGDVPNVVFSCANPVVDGIVYLFYGGGDHVIGLATCSLDDLVDFSLDG
jgi:beta-1,2-mannobiose phosphorylase / 1,2-beta-oligomannan phosphorylase